MDGIIAALFNVLGLGINGVMTKDTDLFVGRLREYLPKYNVYYKCTEPHADSNYQKTTLVAEETSTKEKTYFVFTHEKKGRIVDLQIKSEP